MKGRYPWSEADKQKKKKKMSEPANFSASDGLRRNFPTVQNCPKKGENH